MIASQQCRAARALLDWTQEDLERFSTVKRKTIAELETGARDADDPFMERLKTTLEAAGVEFIPANGGGVGVRLRASMPKLVSRVHDHASKWIGFIVEYRGKKIRSFIHIDALARIALDRLSPLDVFDRDQARIVLFTAAKVNAGAFDPDGRILILPDELQPQPFDPAAQSWTRTRIHAGENYTRVMDAFLLRLNAAGLPKEAALFATSRGSSTTLFLSPAASSWGGLVMPGATWDKCPRPKRDGLTLLVGSGQPFKTLFDD